MTKKFEIHYCPACDADGKKQRLGALASRDGPNGTWRAYTHDGYTIMRCPTHGPYALFAEGISVLLSPLVVPQ